MKTALTLVLLAVLLLPALASLRQDDPVPPKTFETFSMPALLKQRSDSRRPYLQFLKRTSLNCGVYHLAVDGHDGQSPHGQDEVYYVLSGKARFTAGEETVDVSPEDVLFVAAGIEHRFHDIEQDLELLVFFSAARPMAAADTDGGEDDR